MTDGQPGGYQFVQSD